jgi:hypothetical protein
MNISIKRYVCTFGFIAVLAVILVSCGSAPSPNSSSSSSQRTTSSNQAELERRQRIYMEAIREEGYVPRIDDGNIYFKQQSRNYYVIIDSDDPSFVFLLYPNFWSIDSAADRQRAAVAIGNANRTTKVAKAYITTYRGKDDISIGAELFFEDPNDFKALFPRMLNAVNTAVDKIVDEMDQ